MEKRAIIIDVSRYQTNLDKRVLRDGGVSGIIAKSSQGNYNADSMFSQHLMGCKILGLVTGAYHWVDPCVSPELQASFFINSVKGSDPDLLALDVEQYWEDWNEWNKHSITKKFSGREILDCVSRVYNFCKKETNKRIVIYSRVSFFKEYAPEMIPWLSDKDLWLAQYLYKQGVVNLSSWKELENFLPVIKDPTFLPGNNSWKIWQFSGDKFTLPGVYGYANSRSAVDLNFFNGTEEDLKSWVSFSGENNMDLPDVTEEDNEGEIYYINYSPMNIRLSSNTNSAKIGLLESNSKSKIKRVVGKDVWVELEDGGFVALKINNNEYGELSI